MFASFASNDGRVVQVLGVAANSTTSIITLDDHLQTSVIIASIVVVATRIDFDISYLMDQALGFVVRGQIEMF
jgi:hypothetical protein